MGDTPNYLVDLRILAAILLVASSAIGIVIAVYKLRYRRMKLKNFEEKTAKDFVQQFNDSELKRALSGYVIPHCSPSDPGNREGEEYLADTRERIFDYMDRSIERGDRAHHLILADTGMGKTIFCMNYFSHATRKFAKLDVHLVSLAGKDVQKKIRSIGNKSNSVIILDALDEDDKAFGRGRERLNEVFNFAADFRNIIITCRSQFFLSDDHIPRESEIPILVNRKLGQGATYSIVRSYLAPFDDKEIASYIGNRFPLYKFWTLPARVRAMKLAAAIPDLAYRPMLLERLPELALSSGATHELYDLYSTLIDGWLRRERRWIPSDKLEAISMELAVSIYEKYLENKGRVSPSFIKSVATRSVGENPEWEHLTSRSLLNRDSQGKFKFAHKSILEFLVVKAAIGGDTRCLKFEWTPFMRELFISWGYTEDGKNRSSYAIEILKRPESKKSVSPLFDFWLSTPINGMPDFKRCAARKVAINGTRFMPVTWRGSAIDLVNKKSSGEIEIYDHEFNINWRYSSSMVGGITVSPLSLSDVLRIDATSKELSLPGYEQLVTLIEGLYRIGYMILPSRYLFAIGDKPGRYQNLLIEINGSKREIEGASVVDKDRKIFGTNISLTTYLTQPDFPVHRTSVQQLWVVDKSKGLRNGTI